MLGLGHEELLNPKGLDDNSSHWKYAVRIANVISERSDSKGVVVALNGGWGNGKTTILNYIDKLICEKNDHVIRVHFNAWVYGTEEELMRTFFEKSAQHIDKNLPKYDKSIYDLIYSSVSDLLPQMGIKSSGVFVSEYIGRIMQSGVSHELVARLKKSNKRILFLIDNVDRCSPKVLQLIFRLVNLSSEVDYTTFLLAYDKSVVIQLLQELYGSHSEKSAEAFIEKTVQVPLELPLIDQSFLWRFYFKEIEDALAISNMTLTNEQTSQFTRLFINAFSGMQISPRDAKVYGNVLLFSLPILKGEVNPVDLMLVEGLRVFSPKIYKILRQNKNTLISKPTETMSLFRDSENVFDKEELKKLVDLIFEENPQMSRSGLTYLLERLFPVVKTLSYDYRIKDRDLLRWEEEKRVCSRFYFSRYFNYTILDDDISSGEVRELIHFFSRWDITSTPENNPFGTFIKREHLPVVIRKLRNRANEMGQKESLALIVALSQKGQIFTDDNISESMFSLRTQVAMLIGDLIKNIPEFERMAVIKDVYMRSNSAGFIINLFYWLPLKNDTPGHPGFSEEDIETLGKYLGQRLSMLLLETIINKQEIEELVNIFIKYFGREETSSKLKRWIERQPEVLPYIIRYFVPSRYSKQDMRKGDLSLTCYEHLVEHIDVEVLWQSLTTFYPQYACKPESFPLQKIDGPENVDIFMRQFSWFYQQ
ncbi:KAP family P-loop NTPase fold protein [Basilea psittacipulmonis]|uniref:KAP NTPase domain-containing protein n=1 Tax=Basilea psittacipulmonis DSM 24701 TaxID=1072685 RepID=A0A077DG09_9BURK|nr:P-loop NTPase fold protein [Basilea psittacipulmonis]AIL32367.1 hypothetical protein IX83_02690 [Basilea psittacipulmonis DSM 24701]